MRFVQCEPEHLEQVDAYAGHLENADHLASDLKHAETLLSDDGRPLACAGILTAWEGVGEAWSVLSLEALNSFPLALSRRVKRKVSAVMDSGEFRRLSAMAFEDNEKACLWLLAMGFHVEGRHPCFGPGGERTAVSFGRTAED